MLETLFEVPGQGAVRLVDFMPWRGDRGRPPDGRAILYRVRIGKGQLIYLGWEITASQPRRDVNTVEQERSFAEQSRIVFNIVDDVFRK